MSLDNNHVIVLNGSEWRLKIEVLVIDVDYKWEAAIDDISIFVPLIAFIAHLHAIKI